MNFAKKVLDALLPEADAAVDPVAEENARPALVEAKDAASSEWAFVRRATCSCRSFNSLRTASCATALAVVAAVCTVKS